MYTCTHQGDRIIDRDIPLDPDPTHGKHPTTGTHTCDEIIGRERGRRPQCCEEEERKESKRSMAVWVSEGGDGETVLCEAICACAYPHLSLSLCLHVLV